jgi:hypothetical protein
LSNREGDPIIAALTLFFGMLERQYDIQPKVMEADNELTTQKPKGQASVRSVLKDLNEVRRSLQLVADLPYPSTYDGASLTDDWVLRPSLRKNALETPRYLNSKTKAWNLNKHTTRAKRL